MGGAGSDELVLLQASLTSDEFQWRGTASEVDAWKTQLEAYEQGQAPVKDTVHFSLRVSKALGVWMNVSLNTGSDQPELPSITVSSARSDWAPLSEMNKLVSERLAESAKEGAFRTDTGLLNPTFDAFTALQEYLIPFEEAQSSHAAEPPSPAPAAPRPTALSMKRVIFWSHHLVAPSKRKQFAAWCPELRVWGLLKLGYPGFLCFEGEASDVNDMVLRVKVGQRLTQGMQWHAISMRVEAEWTCSVSETNKNVHDQALRACILSKGRPIESDGKLRVNCEEIQDMGAFVAR